MFWEKTSEIVRGAEKFALVGFAFFGFGLIRFWLLIMQFLPAPMPFLPGITGTFFFRLVQIASFLTFVLITSKVRSLHHRGGIVIGATAAMVLASGLAGLSHVVPAGGTFAFLGNILAAAGYSAMFLLWLELYGCLSSPKMLAAYAGSNLAAAAFWELLSSLQIGPLVILALCIPIVSTIMLILAFHKPEAQRAQNLPQGSGAFTPLRANGKLFCWVALFGFAAGFFTPGGGSGILLAHIFTGVLILIGLAVQHSRFDSSILYRIALPFMVVGIILATVVGPNAWYCRMAISIGKECSLAIAFVVICNTAYRRNLSAAHASGQLSAINMAALLAGNILQTYSGPLCEALSCSPSAIPVLLCVLCCVGSALIYTENDFYLQWDETDLSTGRTAARESAVRDVVSQTAAQVGLSAREEEIVQLVAEGKPNGDIAAELFISPGTMRAHMSRIYTKFDVHNRESLEQVLKERGAFDER